MTAERVRIECALQDDPRFAAAIPLIVSHAAHLAGILEKSAEAFANEAAAVCRKALSSAAKAEDHPAILLVVDQFQDRIEITLEHPGEQVSLSDDSSRPFADSVRRESSDGKSRLTFTKFCGAVDSKQSK